MWLNEEKYQIHSKFSFLDEYGFKFEFLSFEKNNIVNVDTLIALIYKKNNYFAIEIKKNYPFEPICFYKLNDKTEIDEIFTLNSSKEIQVYKRDLDLWKSILKKKKFISRSDVLNVVSESIKKQIELNRSFYGISIDDSSRYTCT